ncbi:MAG TPA: alpha/beta hydrolase [Verrucomicrobiae bacterium]|nr:alpha/beta hydrolase [Verrucomicrobiae bacterium]
MESENLELRIYGDPALPTLVYLPGLHGDWTLVASFRAALKDRVHFVEMTYPRSLTWRINDYAEAIESALLEHGITRGWLLAESFGSQLAWPLLERHLADKDQPEGARSKAFHVQGLILAGGFVKHPWPWGPGALRWIGRMTPMWLYRLELKIYSWYSRFRHRKAPEVLDTIAEFVSRRTALDRQAMQHRLTLLDGYDPRDIARRACVPIHYLAGFVDPLVPWVLVRWWLRKNCPTYRGGKTFWLADHNVLATSPARAANLVMKWMREGAAE